MPLRERFKQNANVFKSDVKAFFKRQLQGDDPDGAATRPATSSSAQSHTTVPVVTEGLRDLALDTIKFGPLKDLSDMLQGFADMYIMDDTVKRKYEAVRQRLQKLLKFVEEHSKEELSPVMRSKVQGIRDFIEAELNSIGPKQATILPRQLLMASEQERRFLACCQRIQDFMDQLSLGGNLSIWKMEEQHSKDRMSSLVGRLLFSSSACYNSRAGEELKRRECTPGTRIDVLANLLAWAHNNKSGVYWLNGMAGTGKTTIACSVCKQLDARLDLAASFFCSRLREECRDVNMIIPSIAYQIALRFQSFRSALSTTLETQPDIHTKQLDMQFKALIEEPLLSANPSLPEGLVVVIDALDECENKKSTRDVLRVLLSKAANLPLKFIVSSRPEPQVRDRMTEEHVDVRLVLHELDAGNVQADIKTYLQDELKPMNPAPAETEIAELVQRAGILFIYAATAVRYIGFDNFQRNPHGRLNTILKGSQGKRTSEHKEIDEIYATILEAAFGEPGLEEDELTDMRQLLHTVICAREPLTVSSLSGLLQIEVGRVRAGLRPLWSVLHVVETSELVTTLHASFPDFMFDATRSISYHCNWKAHNCTLVELCFVRIERSQPQFNICELGSSYLPDEFALDMDDRVARAISSELLYACRYWADHVKAGDCASSVIERLWDFLSMRLLLWMEVLNLNKQMAVGMECMKLAVGWCEAVKEQPELIELAEDAKRFVDVFVSNPVSQSTAHIYVSMLAFWPSSSPIAKHYAKYTNGPVRPEGTALERRQISHLSTWAFEKGINTMAVSPDGSAIALVIDQAVLLLVVDSSSGRKLLEPLRGHTGFLTSVAYSTDGTRIISSSINGRNATIVGWDTRSGETVPGPLRLHGHTGDINCLSFSPDHTRIATGSDDRTVRLWDAENGQTVSILATEVEDRVMSAVFSPDGTRVMARFSYQTLYMWDTRTEDYKCIPLPNIEESTGAIFSSDGSCIITYNYDRISVWDAQSGEGILGPVEGHTSAITCIGCSPDGRYIVSGSVDRTVRVWDAQNGNPILGPLQAHTGIITSVIFTPDGSRIISACEDGLVCTWDAQHRSLTPSSAAAPFHRITSAKFSSDGTHFVSGSDEGTISIWDSQTGEMRVGPIEAHTSEIRAVDFLNSRVVSGAGDGTICICDAMTGEVVLGPLQLDSGTIRAIAYSPDGQMIATGSDSGVDMWYAQNGNRVLGPLPNLYGLVLSVQFSPDGTRIIASSGAFGSNMAVWDVSTWRTVLRTLDGHARWVYAVSYSPNGALIASGSADKTIIVWDTSTGEKRLGPLTGHSSWVRSVHFSPDSTRLVSGSNDRTIRIWDVETGELVFELLSGHENGISSVEYSPDGNRILSRSLDMSVRIHDARSPAERALSRAESEIGDWTMNRDGWVVDDQSRLLVWVPGDLRQALMWPRTEVVIESRGYVSLRFDKARMGESWAECFMS